ncbi:putative drug resistance efflux protein [Rhodococcus opacus B4]|uniref:Putative drug resistance efflux protein n=1 Tax=Rhodococcus opacus (strain B4) TaxID=632772 RepID=C1B1A4_RHOOB|nr:putative drug resistance efflux protein [Rhodococcus opacus B4]
MPVTQRDALYRGELGRWVPWLGLATSLAAVFMQLLDATIVNVALPSIAVDLGASVSAQLLMVSVYTLSFACSLITAARLGDLLGRRRVFLTALAVFVLASFTLRTRADADRSRRVAGAAGPRGGVDVGADVRHHLGALPETRPPAGLRDLRRDHRARHDLRPTRRRTSHSVGPLRLGLAAHLLRQSPARSRSPGPGLLLPRRREAGRCPPTRRGRRRAVGGRAVPADLPARGGT